MYRTKESPTDITYRCAFIWSKNTEIVFKKYFLFPSMFIHTSKTWIVFRRQQAWCAYVQCFRTELYSAGKMKRKFLIQIFILFLIVILPFPQNHTCWNHAGRGEYFEFWWQTVIKKGVCDRTNAFCLEWSWLIELSRVVLI